jgi:endo-1,4-beta-xylanase
MVKKRSDMQIGLVVMLLTTLTFAQQETKFLGNIHNGFPDPVFSQYWNQITPENAGKWGSVEFARDFMSWETLDLMVAYAKENNMPVKQHTFIWGQQETAWVAALAPEEQRAEVMEWLESFAERYPDVEMIDVVNEAQHAPPSYKDAIGGDGETGWDWIIWSFEKARELFPNSKLLINDYNILCCEGELTVYKEQIRLLHERGLVDGIGVQSHGLETVSPETIQRHLDSLAEFGLPIYVSELDLREANDLAQLKLYQSIFPVLWHHPAVKGVTLWGYKAGEIWRDTAELINWSGRERPALQWLVKYLEYDRLINGNSR